MPENPKALSPSTHTIRRPFSPLLLSSVAAAIAKPRPTPIVPNVPASNLTGQAEPQNHDCITQLYHMTASPPAWASRAPFLLLHGLCRIFGEFSSSLGFSETFVKSLIPHLVSPDCDVIIKSADRRAHIICHDYINPAVNISQKWCSGTLKPFRLHLCSTTTAKLKHSRPDQAQGVLDSLSSCECRCGATGLPVSRQVVVQHSSSYVHGVGTLADNDAVVRKQLGNMMEHCVVVHGHSWLEGQALWRNGNISITTRLQHTCKTFLVLVMSAWGFWVNRWWNSHFKLNIPLIFLH